MLLVDSHCHLDRLSYGDKQVDIPTVLAKAKERGVGYFLCVSVTQDQFPSMIEAIYPYSNVFASCGVHPLNQEPGVDVERLRLQAADPRVVATGETGLDYYYSPENKSVQQASFREHIRVARELKKPLIIHTRDAQVDTLRIMAEEGADQVGGVLHCFTESLEMAEAAMAMGFYISISGIATFRNAKALQEVVRALPLERLLVETDAPYLAPVPHRGKENEPAFVRDVAQFVADLKEVSLESLAQQTTHNFFELFRLAKQD
ncbi:TatD family hydrolase [Aeromonas schubertii]|uniref:Deoxyribonuclease YcfH n=1 Tax=Aeromonas schubertii TaxID=652 RepID=A0A0S2SMT9_9GAMM|nr:YchF/TatD family DNA exonuclease [Aeromonas schubertii]ALP43016.1 deoxyribonuclease YcfH [Aeromonas schubertii]